MTETPTKFVPTPEMIDAVKGSICINEPCCKKLCGMCSSVIPALAPLFFEEAAKVAETTIVDVRGRHARNVIANALREMGKR